jgi:hypothetical protein
VEEADAQMAMSSVAVTAERTLTPLDTISGADSQLVLDAPIYYHWPPGKFLGILMGAHTRKRWLHHRPACRHLTPGWVHCSHCVAHTGGGPDLAEDDEQRGTCG